MVFSQEPSLDTTESRLQETEISTEASRETVDAQAALQLLNNEMIQGLSDRNINSRFALFQGYAQNRLNVSASDRTGSELTGTCRLPWYDALYRDIVSSPFEMEDFSSQLHNGLTGSTTDYLDAWSLIRTKMSVAPRSNEASSKSCDSPDAALAEVQRALLEASDGFSRSIAPLTEAEVATGTDALLHLNSLYYPIHLLGF